MGTVVTWLALILGLVALGYAWLLQQELARATRRLDRYNRALYDVNEELRRLREELADNVAQLRVEAIHGQHRKPAFAPQMPVREALLVHPQAEQILAGFHLGGCSSCAVDPDETLAQICREHGRDLEELLANLNQLLGSQLSKGAELPLLVKIPNVEFSFE